jgi:8-oxo-dGTP pyrophosphatase MutT (NUDIX family)
MNSNRITASKKQKVPDWFYYQSGVIPYVWEHGNIKILLITNRKMKKWIIPKGVIEPDKTAYDSARQEAYEEAGILGKLYSVPIGEYQYNKWNGTCNVEVYRLEIEQILPEWPENFRYRVWFGINEAVECIKEKKLKKLIQRMSHYGTNPS